MSYGCSRFSLTFAVALVVGLAAAMPAAQAAAPVVRQAAPAPQPTPTPLPATAPLCNLETCNTVCQTNNPEKGFKQTCASSCTATMQNRKRNGVCK
jgi:hypothetical protein